MSWVEWHEDLEVRLNNDLSDFDLCFQKVVYHYDDGTTQDGFRFIWRYPGGNLQPARGQARIPGKQDLDTLLARAAKAGWYK